MVTDKVISHFGSVSHRKVTPRIWIWRALVYNFEKNPLSLLDRKSPLLVQDSHVRHKPRREPGNLAEVRLPAFPWSMPASKFARAERHQSLTTQSGLTPNFDYS